MARNGSTLANKSSKRRAKRLGSKCKSCQSRFLNLISVLIHTLSRTRSPSEGGILVNTDRAHRLAYRAWNKGGQSLQQTVLSNLFHALIIDQKDISNISILSDIANASCLMSKSEVISIEIFSHATADLATAILGHRIPRIKRRCSSGRGSIPESPQKWDHRGSRPDHRGKVGHQWRPDQGRLRSGELPQHPCPGINLGSHMISQVFKKIANCSGFSNSTSSPETTAKALSAKFVREGQLIPDPLLPSDPSFCKT